MDPPSLSTSSSSSSSSFVRETSCLGTNRRDHCRCVVLRTSENFSFFISLFLLPFFLGRESSRVDSNHRPSFSLSLSLSFSSLILHHSRSFSIILDIGFLFLFRLSPSRASSSGTSDGLVCRAATMRTYVVVNRKLSCTCVRCVAMMVWSVCVRVYMRERHNFGGSSLLALTRSALPGFRI